MEPSGSTEEVAPAPRPTALRFVRRLVQSRASKVAEENPELFDFLGRIKDVDQVFNENCVLALKEHGIDDSRTLAFVDVNQIRAWTRVADEHKIFLEEAVNFAQQEIHHHATNTTEALLALQTRMLDVGREAVQLQEDFAQLQERTIDCATARFTVENMSYSVLMSSSQAELKNAFVSKVKQTMAHEGGPGFLPEQVQIKLTEGSINVEATIVLPISQIEDCSLESKLTDDEMLSTRLFEQVICLSGIEAACTGDISISDASITRNDADIKKMQSELRRKRRTLRKITKQKLSMQSQLTEAKAKADAAAEDLQKLRFQQSESLEREERCKEELRKLEGERAQLRQEAYQLRQAWLAADEANKRRAKVDLEIAEQAAHAKEEETKAAENVALQVIDQKEQGKNLHYSFASEDALFLLKYMSRLDATRPDGWRMTSMLAGSIADGAWFPAWNDKCCKADGALIVATDTYFSKLSEPGSPLLKEAGAILKKHAADENFRVFALNPRRADQGESALRCLLLDNVRYMNVGGWKRRVEDAKKLIPRTKSIILKSAHSWAPTRAMIFACGYIVAVVSYRIHIAALEASDGTILARFARF